MIWLLRHGDAERGGEDAARRLTSKGERQAEQAGRALAALGVDLAACLSSPKVRAFDTARHACRDLDVEAEAVDELAEGDFDAVKLARRAVPSGNGDLLLVGHEPHLSKAIARATGAGVKMKKGGLAALDEGVLHALLRPVELGAIAAGRPTTSRQS